MKNQEIREYLDLFNNKQAYFEAHEVLEEAWLKHTNASTKDHPYIMLIQLAAIMLHWQRQNFKGANSIMKNVKQELPKQQDNFNKFNLSYDNTLALVLLIDKHIIAEAPYIILKLSL